MIKKLFIIALILLNAVYAFTQIKFVAIGNSISHGKYTNGIFHGTTIGDSLTEMSYRFWLWEKLDSAGVNATMVGSNTTYFEQGANPVVSVSRYTGHTFVNNSEAYYGIKSDGFLAGGWNGNPDFDTRLAGFTPDVALMHIGSNDPYTNAAQIDATEANIKLIIQKMRAKNPNVTILLAKLSSFWSGINARVDSIVTETSQVNSIVYAVDIASDFFLDDKGAKSFLLDGIHPNVKGQKIMAKRWYEAYMKISKTDSEKPTVPTGLYATAMTASSIDLKWFASTDNTGINVYKIYMNDVLVAETGNLTYKITGINTSTTTYTFKVSAVDYQKNESDKCISIKAPSSVTFTVTNGTTPLSGASVIFNSITQTTNASGTTTFAGLRPGSFNYTVKATDYKNRAGNVIVKTDTTISIALSNVALSIEGDETVVFPNPASDHITVAFANGAEIRIVNAAGICLLSAKAASNEEVIDIGSLAEGYYSVLIIKDKKTVTKKIQIFK